MRPTTLLLVLSLSCALACGYIPTDLRAWTAYYAQGFGLETDLLTALIWVESRYCPEAVSSKGAVGLGQLMPATARELGVDPRNPQANLYGAALYLRRKWEEFGDWRLALAAYNAGSPAVCRYGGVPPFPETQNYVNNVLGVYFALRR